MSSEMRKTAPGGQQKEGKRGMTEKHTLFMDMLCRKLERMHSAMIAITAAMENVCGRYEPQELVPALEELTERLYCLAAEVRKSKEA